MGPIVFIVGPIILIKGGLESNTRDLPIFFRMVITPLSGTQCLPIFPMECTIQIIVMMEEICNLILIITYPVLMDKPPNLTGIVIHMSIRIDTRVFQHQI